MPVGSLLRTCRHSFFTGHSVMGVEDMTEEQKKQVTALRKQGLGYKKVAQILDISVDSVKYYCRKNALTGKIQPKAATEGICLKCGKQLVQPEKKKRIKFCCKECRESWWREHRKDVNRKSAEPIVCAHCGKTVLAYAHEKRKYCSFDCYIEERFRGGGSK